MGLSPNLPGPSQSSYAVRPDDDSTVRGRSDFSDGCSDNGKAAQRDSDRGSINCPRVIKNAQNKDGGAEA